MLEACFVWNGRLGRLAYFGYSLLIVLVLAVIAAVLLLPTRNSPNGATVAFVVIGLFGVVAGYAGFCLCVKRLHDLDLPGWHYLWMVLVPSILNGAGNVAHSLPLSVIGGLVSLGVGLYLLFWPGTDGTNRFGYPPS
jgi:uncharacterized membrane protein YhaH (DUF805 family)